MEIQVLNKDKENTTFALKNIDISFANALRRIMVTEVPAMAIDRIEYRSNDSILYDEILGHRLGLVSIKTDLKSYDLPESEEDIEEKKAKCVTIFTLKEKGPKMVYASDLESNDPKIIPVHPKTILVKLLKGQSLEFEASAILGQGKDHMKWSPCHAFYSYKPTLTINDKSDKLEEFKNKYPPQIFNNNKIDKNIILDQNLVDACEGVCDDIISVEYDNKNLIFTIESWGQLSCKEIGVNAAEILENKCNEFSELLKTL